MIFKQMLKANKMLSNTSKRKITGTNAVVGNFWERLKEILLITLRCFIIAENIPPILDMLVQENLRNFSLQKVD